MSDFSRFEAGENKTSRHNHESVAEALRAEANSSWNYFQNSSQDRISGRESASKRKVANQNANACSLPDLEISDMSGKKGVETTSMLRTVENMISCEKSFSSHTRSKETESLQHNYKNQTLPYGGFHSYARAAESSSAQHNDGSQALPYGGFGAWKSRQKQSW